jgi:CDP-Glycerol:Poly(glycerophosphate) glycerophosphotransferase
MSALGSAVGIIRSRVRGRALARRIARQTPIATPVAVYFADGPESLYQLRRWYRVLEALNATRPTGIVTSDPATYELVRRETTVPVTFATGAPQLTSAFERQDVRVVLYPNHNALNFRVLRFPKPVHVFIGHGNSGKDSSVSRQLKAYDRTFVSDAAAVDLLRGIRGYDAEANAVIIGSPWLGFPGAVPESWTPDGRTVVLYAPTWEGDRPSMDYGSVEALGDAIVEAVLASPSLRLIYRPHPWLGRVRPASAAADARLRRTIVAAGRGSLVDTGEYGWALNAADLIVTDVSSVASDAEALGKKLLLTPDLAGLKPAELRELIENASATASTTPTPTVSMDALLAAVDAALSLSD